MRRKILILALALLPTLFAHAQQDSVLYTPEFLDSLDLSSRRGELNDYSMIGVNYGVTFSNVFFNPMKMGTEWLFRPTYFSVMFTHYQKMFNYLPYFGFTLGFSYGHSGVKFKNNPETGFPMGFIDGATYETMETVQIPAMMQMHVDSHPVKFLVDLGGYIGYRLSMSRSGEYLDDEYTDKFRDYEYRFDYGIAGGLGLAYMLDPVEFHLKLQGRWSLQSLYVPNYYNSMFHPYNEYYYRFGNPVDLALTFGVYIQLTRPTGKTNRQLRQQAHDIVYGTPEDD